MKHQLLGTCVALLVLIVMPHIAGAAPARAMWVYKTEDVMTSAAEQELLFAFCKQRQITDMFWQVDFAGSPEHSSSLKNVEENRLFLAAAHAQGVHIHALSGDPSHTLTKNHERVCALADALLAFNQTGERFDGLHLDIEPHALPQWKKASAAEKCDLLTQMVDVHTKVVERLHTADKNVVYGADIVFWLDKIKPDGSPAYPVTYRGKAKDAAKHLLDVVDHVGIMSYRNTAEGRNGITALVAKTIAYADTVKGRAFVGVKMADIGPEMESFFGQTEESMMTALKPVDETYQGHRGYAGLAFFMYEAFKTMPR